MGGEEIPDAKPAAVGEEPNPSVVPVDTDMARAPSSAPHPSWFTPKRLLVIFCVINMINYVDRGAIASNGVNGSQGTCTKGGTCSAGTGIQGDFHLNNFQDGVLSSAFMVGLLVASPIFASLAKRLVGVGEASFISLAAPFIDDNAPVAQRAAWLGLFYMCIPTGVALGYVYGGLVGNQWGWRVAFFGEAVMMLPFAILGFVMKPLHLKDASNDKDGQVTDRSSKKPSSCTSAYILNLMSKFLQDMKVLLLDNVYVVNVLGYIAYNFVIGSYSYWGPKAGYAIYHMSNADTLFGGITIVGGIVGTLAGGFVLDFMGSTIKNAFKLLSMATFLGAIFCFAAFCFKSLYLFMAFFLIGEILVFATQGPVNYVCLHTVKPSMRPISMAMSTVSIHIFGDVPSAPLVGLLQDHIHNWRKSTLILTSILFLAAMLWFLGILLHSVDRFDEDSEHPVVANRANTRPLLEEKTVEAREVSISIEP